MLRKAFEQTAEDLDGSATGAPNPSRAASLGQLWEVVHKVYYRPLTAAEREEEEIKARQQSQTQTQTQSQSQSQTQPQSQTQTQPQSPLQQQQPQQQRSRNSMSATGSGESDAAAAMTAAAVASARSGASLLAVNQPVHATTISPQIMSPIMGTADAAQQNQSSRGMHATLISDSSAIVTQAAKMVALPTEAEHRYFSGTALKDAGFDPEDPIYDVLTLLRCLFALVEHVHANVAAHFNSVHLTAKLLRQVQDPLALCSGGHPEWCSALVTACPFLFSFDTRRFYLHCVGLGTSRALHYLQDRQPESAGSGMGDRNDAGVRVSRIPRQKLRVNRELLFESAVKAMQHFATVSSVIEIEYSGEVGSGLGPTMEFYTLVCRELQRTDLAMWRSGGQTFKLGNHTYVNPGHSGLFPRPYDALSVSSRTLKKVLDNFTFLGRLFGRALIDSRLLDLPVSPCFFRLLLGDRLGLADLERLDPVLHKSLNDILACPDVSGLGLDFTCPGYSEIELVPDGANIAVTNANVREYVDLAVSRLLSPTDQVAAFRDGFEEVLSISHLRYFSGAEILQLFLGDFATSGSGMPAATPWTMEELRANIQCDHGYSSQSRCFEFLCTVLTEMDYFAQRDFLLFLSGCPRLPIGGWAALTPKMTVVRKVPASGANNNNNNSNGAIATTPTSASTLPPLGTDSAALAASYDLPSVMTCANFLKLPDYPTKEILKEKLYFAMREGQGSFHLS